MINEQVNRRYTWKLYLTKEQRTALFNESVMCVDLWNALLSICEARFSAVGQRETKYFYDKKGRLKQVFTGRMLSFHCAACAALYEEKGKLILCEEHKIPSYMGMTYWIKPLRQECPEWRELSTGTPKRVMDALDKAFQAFFRRIKSGDDAGYPRYKSRRRANAVPYMCDSGCYIRKSDRHKKSWNVELKGVPGEIWARGKLPKAIDKFTVADVDLDRSKISFAVRMNARRESCSRLIPMTIRFDLHDSFASVNGIPITLEGLTRARELDDKRAELQSEFDKKYPRRQPIKDERERSERLEMRTQISRLAQRATDIRNNALHVWTKQLVERASVMTIYKPDMKKNVQTPRGSNKEWGANVDTVSNINRIALSHAPGMAVGMLEYKAKELGIRCDVLADTTPMLRVGAELVSAGKTIRKAGRRVKESIHGTV